MVNIREPKQWTDWICNSKNDSEVRSKYDAWADTYDNDVKDAYSSVPKAVAQMVAKHMSTESKGANILDFGAGTGLVGSALADLGYTNITGTDLSQAMLDKAQMTGAYSSLIACAVDDAIFETIEPPEAVVSVGVFSEGQAGPEEMKSLYAKGLSEGGLLIFTARRGFGLKLQTVLHELPLKPIDFAELGVHEDPMELHVFRVSKSSPVCVLKDKEEGQRLLEELDRVNRELEQRTDLNREKLMEMGIIRESKEPVHQLGGPNTVPFWRLMLPVAHTGIFHPKKEVTDIHSAIQILLPGCGTTFSVAETLFDIANKFHGKGGKKRAGKRRDGKVNPEELGLLAPSDNGLRVASFPMDLPFNGMGSDAPDIFFSEVGLVKVIRHAHLVLSHLYPGRPVFVGGRSQGGAAAILYGQHYPDVGGVFAVNPPYPDDELIEYSVEFLEEKADVLDELLHCPGVSLHDRSWTGFKDFTLKYTYPLRPSLVPTLIYVSLFDDCNKFPLYEKKVKEFCEEPQGKGRGTRKALTFEAGHNLWDRRGKLYDLIISEHCNFITNAVSDTNATVG